MGHINTKKYSQLQERLDDVAQGAPGSESLFGILKILFTEREAELVSKVPVNFFTLADAVRIWHVSEKEAKRNLNDLADKGILLDFKKEKIEAYFLAPTMAGFFEFALMRSDGKFDEELLSKLFHQYLNVEEGYLDEVFALDVPLYRIYIQENTIEEKDQSIVMDYERVSNVIKNANFVTVSTCYCRHKAEHLGKDCDNPKRACLTFNEPAKSLHEHGIAEKITKEEAFRIVDECKKLGLVQLGDNIQKNINWICNCCSCCCDGLDAYRRLGHKPRIETNFVSSPDKEKCIACGTCVKKCPVNAIQIHESGNKAYAVTDYDKCIGCGVCANFCPTKCIRMDRRDEMNFVPVDTFERYILNAIDEGKLQNYIFDNRDLWTHELMRRFLKVFVSLKPVKMMAANRQLRSRFLNILARTKHGELFNEIYNDGKINDYSHPELKHQNK